MNHYRNLMQKKKGPFQTEAKKNNKIQTMVIALWLTSSKWPQLYAPPFSFTTEFSTPQSWYHLNALTCSNHVVNKLSISWNGDCFRLFLWPENLTHCAFNTYWGFHILTILLDADSAVPNLAASRSSFTFFFPTQNAFIATKINHKQKLK